ncbi:hypothetical protein GF343_03195 [Candidatus Woesearchaeota archaeon]|nr:hypothetical protein [Candidatus Woesearchaeota archaeon]
MNYLTAEEEQALKQYRPLLNNGKHANITVDDIIESLDIAFHIAKSDPKDLMFTYESIFREHMSDKLKAAYLNSSIELKIILPKLLQYAIELGPEIKEWAEGRQPRESIPLELTPENHVYLLILKKFAETAELGVWDTD